MKAVVIGGGLAGLAAGYRLHKARWEVTLLEENAVVGGRANSIQAGPYLLENGATQISTGYKAYLALAEELGLRDSIVPASNIVGLLSGGRLYEINGKRPFRTVFSGALNLGSKLRMVYAVADFMTVKPQIDVLDLSASHERDFESAQQYCLRRLNRQILDVLIDPAIRCYTLNRAADTSVLDWFGFLRNLAGQEFLAVRGGSSRLPDKLASHLDVRLSSSATEVRSTASGVNVTYRSGSGGEVAILEADACVIATPLPRAVHMAPEIAAGVEQLSRLLTYNRAVVVHLGFRKPTLSRAIGVLVGTVEHSQIALVWLEHNKLPEAAPEGHSLLTVYFEEGGIDTVRPDSDARFIEIALQFTTRLFPELSGECDLRHVARWTAAIPHPTPGFYQALHKAHSRLQAASRIQLAGDYFTCTGQNSAIHWGQAAADRVTRCVPWP